MSKDEIKILVAEDIDSNFLLVQAILKGYHVERALNGMDAVEMAMKGGYACIFMDMKMPVMNGLDATQSIRKFDKEIPIVIVTANAFDCDRRDALKAGCTSFLAKPITRTDLLNALNDCLKAEK